MIVYDEIGTYVCDQNERQKKSREKTLAPMPSAHRVRMNKNRHEILFSVGFFFVLFSCVSSPVLLLLFDGTQVVVNMVR